MASRSRIGPSVTLLVASLATSAAFAQPETVELRVMTFNIWYGGDQVNFASAAEAIRKADADIVGIQEPEGNLQRLAEAAGYAYVDTRRNILSRYPLFDSGTGRRKTAGTAPAGITALDEEHLHAWVMVRPGEVVAVANTHLSSDLYGPEAIRDGATLDAVLATEKKQRLPEAEPLLALRRLPANTPVFLTGDFNTPSHLDWTTAMQRVRPQVIRYPVSWPVTRLLAEAGFKDSFREAHPDPTVAPGYTWTAGMPHPYVRPRETIDRIDYIFTAGPVDTLRSELIGEPAGDGVDVAIKPYPSDHRAVVSTFKVMPTAAPALISVEPRTVARGADFLIRGFDPRSEGWRATIVPAGPVIAEPVLQVNEPVGAWRRATPVNSRNMAAGEYDAILLGEDGREAARTRFVVRETRAALTLLLPDSVRRPGLPLRVRWSNGPGNRHDAIGLFKIDAPVGEALTRTYVDARYSGEIELATSTVEGPLPAGNYEIRFLRDDSPLIEASLRVSLR